MHTAGCVKIMYENLLSQFCLKNFVKPTFLLLNYTKRCLHEIFLKVRVNFMLFHAQSDNSTIFFIICIHLFCICAAVQIVVKSEKSHWKKIPSNQLFSKNVAFTKFLTKKCERKIPQFPNCAHAIFLFYFNYNAMYSAMQLIFAKLGSTYLVYIRFSNHCH